MNEIPTPTLAFHHDALPRGCLPRTRQSDLSVAEEPLAVSWAKHTDEVREAQRLRYAVFSGEMGARLATSITNHDVDRFDDYCEHLLVRDPATDVVVGTYRVLTPAQARRAGGTYSDTEFDLTKLQALRPRMVELGRSCVHPQYRSGTVILALWRALGEFMVSNGLDSMIGCASVPMRHNGVNGGEYAASVWAQLSRTHLAPVELRVTPRLALPLATLDCSLQVKPPALISGYLRMGSRVLGEPAWDPEFNTADLPLLMQLSELPGRYRKHFIGL